MFKVFEADKLRISWRVTDPKVLEALGGPRPDQVATDGRAYRDHYAAHKAVMAYRELLRRRRPDLRMRCRIAKQGRRYQWFARMEPRT